MLDHQRSKIETLIEHGYDFRISHYISEGWNIYKQKAIQFAAFLFVIFLIYIFVGFIPYIGSPLVTFILAPCLGVGFFLVSDRVKKGTYTDFGDFFKGFDYLAQLALVTLVTSAIFLIVLLPTILMLRSTGIFEWYAELLENPMATPPDFDFESIISSGNLSIFFLNWLPVIYLGVAFSWAQQFVIFEGMTFWEAIESSRRVITRQWFSMFFFYLALGGITLIATIILSFLMVGVAQMGILGILLIFILTLAIFGLLPFFSCAIYASFEDVVMKNLKEKGAEDDIINHLVD